MTLTIHDIAVFLEQFAPSHLAEEWDNVGLLVGDRQREAKKVMTCLTITPDSAAEAIDEKADLIVTHHPLPFKGLKQLTTDTTAGRSALGFNIRADLDLQSAHRVRFGAGRHQSTFGRRAWVCAAFTADAIGG